jgi:hypothetical protein
MLRNIICIGIFSFCLQAFLGCVNDAPVPPPKELKLGDSISLGSITVNPGGGSFQAGLATIMFPSNSYPAVKVVNMSVSDIAGSTFGNNITAISSLYTVDAGSDFSQKDIIFSIPVTLDTNNFSMAFFYDKITHELEGIPTVGYVTINGIRKLSIAFRRSGSFFVSTIAKSKLVSSISTSFDPKSDNWEFPNFETAITPNGQFAGQSLSALWYYYEQTLKGKSHLYGQFDLDHGGEPPKIWQDNDLGFRVAAETQLALKWNNNALDMIGPLNNGNISITTNQIIYSMMVTGKPQLITVMKDTNVLPLIVYKVTGGNFYVADPNYPLGESQTIYDLKSSLYNTAVSMFDLSANGTSKFGDPTYIGVRALIDWDAITKIWTDAQNNTFTTFPPYTIGFSDPLGSLKPSANGFVTLFDTVTFSITGNQPSSTRIYQNNIFSIFTTSNNIPLQHGPNHISIYFLNPSTDQSHSLWSGFSSYTILQQTFSISPALDSCFVENDITLRALMAQKPPGSLRYEWNMGDGSPVITNTDLDSIKYRYKKTGSFTVALTIYQANTNTLIGKETSTVVVSLNHVIISSTKFIGIINIPYVFYAYINVPNDITQRCEWSMGDGSSVKSNIGFDSLQYTFQNAGTYILKLNIYDNVTNALLGSTQNTITITQMQLPTMSQLQSMKSVNIQFIGAHQYSSDSQRAFTYLFGGVIPVWNFTVNGLIWNNSICTGTSFRGVINPAITSLDTFGFSQSSGTSNYDPTNHRFLNSTYTSLLIEGLSIPIAEFDGNTITYTIKGPSVQYNITRIWYTGDFSDRYEGSGKFEYISTNWFDPVNQAELIFTFYK